MTGNDWNAFNDLEMDEETKITEFEYENYLSPELLDRVDTKAPEFKKLVRQLNFNTKTAFERHKDSQQKFSELMSEMGSLSDDEKRAMIHLIKNRHGGCTPG